MKAVNELPLAAVAIKNAEASWMDDIKVHNSTYFTAEMLQRTSLPDVAAASVWASDHFALERMARGLRQDHVAHLVYAGQLWIAGRLAAVLRGSRAAVHVWASVGRAIGAMFDVAAAHAARWQRTEREAYLAQAVDVYDLERRMRDLERRYQRSFG